VTMIAAGKNRLVTFLLCIFFGMLGVHRFYLGQFKLGLLMLLTCGGFAIWWVIDLFRILFGFQRDSYGRYLPWFGSSSTLNAADIESVKDGSDKTSYNGKNTLRSKSAKKVNKQRVSKKEKGMKKLEALNQDINPDGISIPLDGLDDEVWDRGYYCETVDGTWYELYVVDSIKELWGDFSLNDPEEKEMFECFSDFNVSMFEEYGQITFFVPIGDEENGLDALTEIFI